MLPFFTGSALLRPEIPSQEEERRQEEEQHNEPKLAQDFEDIRRQAFTAFQPICSRLLSQRNDPTGLGDLLTDLRSLIRTLPPVAVQSCIDYVIFPLQMAVSAIAATRGGVLPSSRNSNNSELAKEEQSAAAALPALRSDKAAETALEALESLLEKGQCTSGSQLVGLLYRLCGILGLPRTSAAEEIRLKTLEIITVALKGAKSDVSLQAALKEESTATLIGHLSSLLLTTAAGELQQGTLGSKKVRIQALKALGVFIKVINCPEALSFFLPGLGSGLCKALLAAGSGIRRGGSGGQGPAASGAAAVEALEALTCLLVATLGNLSVESVLLLGEERAADVSLQQSTGGLDSELSFPSFFPGDEDPWDDSTSGLFTSSGKDTLAALKELSLKKEGKLPEEESTADAEKKTTGVSPPPPSLPPLKEGEIPKLQVERSEGWVMGSAGKIKELLEVTLPPLGNDPRPEVREALVHGKNRLKFNK